MFTCYAHKYIAILLVPDPLKSPIFLCSVDKDSHDITAKVNELRNKLQRAREQIEKLKGIEYSQEEQKRQVEVLRKQLISKTDLLRKYKDDKSLIHFD